MSYPARGLCKGIDGKANGFGRRHLRLAVITERSGGSDMSYPARGLCKGIDGKANGFGRRHHGFEIPTGRSGGEDMSYPARGPFRGSTAERMASNGYPTNSQAGGR